MRQHNQKQPRQSRFTDYLIFLAVAAFVVLFARSCCHGDCYRKAYGGQKDRTEFIKGLDYGKVFLKAKSKKGKKHRKGINKSFTRFGPWFLTFMPWELVPGARRAWIESRLNWWSRTKDETLLEAGMMSNGYEFTRWVCMEYGICGDPCGDPKFSIALAGFRRYVSRKRMLYEEGFWEEWLLEQCEENRWECEAFIGACGSINCQKLRKSVAIADKQKGIKNHKHSWWQLMIFFRDQSQASLEFIFHPKPASVHWKLGARIGMVMAALNMRAEFHTPPGSGEKHYGWGDDLIYFPFRTEVRMIGGVAVAVQVPDLPEPLHKWTKKTFPKRKDWRKRCFLYGTKNWKTAIKEPKPKDRWKKAGMRYKWDGTPINVKKGEKKYKTQSECEAAHAAWVDKTQAEGRLPTDEEYAALPKLLKTYNLKWIYQVE